MLKEEGPMCEMFVGNCKAIFGVGNRGGSVLAKAGRAGPLSNSIRCSCKWDNSVALSNVVGLWTSTSNLKPDTKIWTN